MPTQPPSIFRRFGSRLADILDPIRTARLDAATHAMEVAIRNYNDGPLVLTRDNLVTTLKEAGHNQDLLMDLIDSLQWEAYGTAPALSDTQRQRAARTSRRLWISNPLYQWGVWLWTNYGFGEELSVEPVNELAARVWKEFWVESSLLAADRIQNLSHETLVDGESFLAYHADDSTGRVTMTSIDPEEITEIITHPEDRNKAIFYKREFNTISGGIETLYYPDWEMFFDGIIDRPVNQDSPKTLAQLLNIPDDRRADRKWTQAQIDPTTAQFATEGNGSYPRMMTFQEDGVLKIRAQRSPGSPGTITVMQHIPFNRKSRKSLRGWPLSTVSNPWLYSHRQFVSDRLAVSAGKASVIRRYQTKGGSQAVQAIRGNIASALSRYNLTDSNPPGSAGGSLVHNEAISDFQDMSMVTGAGDAKNDNETFSWMAILGLGSFPHYFGLGDAYRLATATSMEKPLELTYSAYRRFWSAQFTRMARIVFMFNNLFGTIQIADPAVIVTTDRATTIDLINAAPAIKALFSDSILPAVDKGILPGDVATTIGREVIMLILDSLGASGDRGEIADMLTQWLKQKKKDEEEAATRAQAQAPPQDEEPEKDEDEDDATTSAEQLTLPPDLDFLRENIAAGTVDVATLTAHVIELLEEAENHE